MSPPPASSSRCSRSKPRRDLRAADEALARLRAELGDDAVVRAVLRDGHLPEASFGWERLVHAGPAAPPADAARCGRWSAGCSRGRSCCRRRSGQVRDDGWLLSGLEHGCGGPDPRPVPGLRRLVDAVELHREYHFAELRRGDCLWVYYDRNRRRWFWHGAVE